MVIKSVDYLMLYESCGELGVKMQAHGRTTIGVGYNHMVYPWEAMMFQCLVFQGPRWIHFWEQDGFWSDGSYVPTQRVDEIIPSSYKVATVMKTGLMSSMCVYCEEYSPLTTIHHKGCPGTRRMEERLERDAAWVRLENRWEPGA